MLQCSGLGPGGAQAIGTALQESRSLLSLDLYVRRLYCSSSTNASDEAQGNGIGESGAAAIAECLRKNRTLTALQLKDNNIGCGGAEALAEALQHNDSLASLSVSVRSVPTLMQCRRVSDVLYSLGQWYQ